MRVLWFIALLPPLALAVWVVVLLHRLRGEQLSARARGAEIELLRSAFGALGAGRLEALFFLDLNNGQERILTLSDHARMEYGALLSGSESFLQALGTYAENAVYPEDRYAVSQGAEPAFWLEHLTGQRSHSLEFRRLEGERLRYTLLIGCKAEAAEEEPGRMVLALLDIDEERRRTLTLEEELSLSRREAQSADRTRSTFLSRMSHNIRTPINGILGMTSIAARHLEDPARTAESLDKITEAARQLLSMTNDVLQASRLEGGHVVIESAPLRPEVLAEDCCAIAAAAAAEKGVRLLRETDTPAHPVVLGDEAHLRQILTGLLDNAIKFTPAGGTVTLRTRETAAEENGVLFQFEVEDTGIGMSEDFLSRIWEPFTRENEEASGIGLGLAVARQLIDAMGGSVTVSSRLDVGSLFVVRVPLALPEETAPVIGEEIPLRGVRFLLAEDNELNREIATELLEDEGAVVLCAGNGQEALDLFERGERVDIVLMDIMMPVMDGLEAARRIRTLDRVDARTVPIIALTANAFDEDIRRSREAGMNAHLSKPIDLAALLSAVRTCLKDREASLYSVESATPAGTDALTGIRSAASLTLFLGELDSRIANGENLRFGILTCDVLGMAAVNEARGREAGDEVLRILCSELKTAFPHGTPFRAGGDRFAVILTDRGYETRSRCLTAFREEMTRAAAKDRPCAAVGMSVFFPDQDAGTAAVLARAQSDMAKDKRRLREAIPRTN